MWMARFSTISGESGGMKGNNCTLHGDRRWVSRIVRGNNYNSFFFFFMLLSTAAHSALFGQRNFSEELIGPKDTTHHGAQESNTGYNT